MKKIKVNADLYVGNGKLPTTTEVTGMIEDKINDYATEHPSYDDTEIRGLIQDVNNKINTSGDGSKFLSDDGTYKIMGTDQINTVIEQAITEGRISNYDDTEVRGLIGNKVDKSDMYKTVEQSYNINLSRTGGLTTATITKLDDMHTQVAFPGDANNYYCYNQFIGKVKDYRNSYIKVKIQNLNDTEMPVLNKLLLSYRQDWSKQIKHANTIDDTKIPVGGNRTYIFDMKDLISSANDEDDIYLIVGTDRTSYNYSFVVSCDIEFLNNKEYYVLNAENAEKSTESKHAEKSDMSINTKHFTNGARLLNNWTVWPTNNKFVLNDNVYSFKFLKDTDSVPDNWWLSIMSSNLGLVSELSGKKLYLSATQCTDSGYGKYTKICLSSKNTNWVKAYDLTTQLSDGKIYVVVDLDKVIASGLVDTNETSSLYLLLGATHGNDENPTMDRYNYDWSVCAAIVDNDFEAGLGISNFVGEFSENDIKDIQQKITNLTNSVSNEEKYITCWGDSLTAMGGWTTRLKTLSGLNLYNGGVGGENCRTILARQGADAMVLENITIPGDTTEVEIKKYTDGGLDTVLGNKVFPALQNNNNLNPVDVNGVECTLKWTGSNYSDTTGTWTIKRNVSGDDIVINRPTIIRTAYDRLYNNPYLMIIFIGQNKGYDDDLDVLVRQHRSIIEHANAKHVIVLGLSSGDAVSRKPYEERMKKEFGRYFISLREYLAHPIYDTDGSTIVSCYGIDDQGLTANTAYEYGGNTYNSLEEIAKGKVPHQILMDGLHFSSGTRTVIGDLIYKRCKELNIF